MYNVYVKRIFVITEIMHMNAGVSSEKENVKESQSQSRRVTPPLDIHFGCRVGGVTPDQRTRSLRCEYHRDHGHKTNYGQSLKFLVEKLIRAGHLRRYIREPTRGVAVTPADDRVVVDIEHASSPRPAINFILGGRPIASIGPKSGGEKCSVQPQSEPR